MQFARLAAAAGVLLAVGVGAAAGPTTAVAASPYPVGAAGSSTITSTVYAPGAPVTVTVRDTTPGPLTLQIFSAPVTIGTGTTGADGTGSVTGIIPLGYSGDHTLQVSGAGGELYVYTVTIAPADAGPASPADAGTANGLANTGTATTGIGILGGLLVVGGVFFVVVGRRRPDPTGPTVQGRPSAE